jgi:SAM-dependent methyltransferase
MKTEDLNLVELFSLFEGQRGFLKEKKESDPNWQSTRSPEGKFKLVEKDFPWGKRSVYVPNDPSHNQELQKSRGIPLTDNDTNDEMKQKVLEYVKDTVESDHVRIKELDYVLKKAFPDRTLKGFCEIGFRIPRLQNFYRDQGMVERGYDINPFNVSLGKSLGFDCQFFDLNDTESEIDIKDFDLIVCYHVLEHVHDPFETLKMIHRSASPGTIFHLEIPVEPDGPRIKYGHLYPFFQDDMHKMLQLANFKLISKSNETHKDGPWIERYTVMKG